MIEVLPKDFIALELVRLVEVRVKSEMLCKFLEFETEFSAVIVRRLLLKIFPVLVRFFALISRSSSEEIRPPLMRLFVIVKVVESERDAIAPSELLLRLSAERLRAELDRILYELFIAALPAIVKSF